MTSLEPDREPGQDGIVGVKLARLVTDGTRVSFAPRFPRQRSTPYGAIADAVCESEETHTAPAPHCRCGFHAVSTREDLWRLEPTRDAVVLEVELAGVVVEHEFGWRAAHQEVLGLALPATCTRRRCRRRVAGVAMYRQFVLDFRIDGWRPLRAVCARCGRRRLVPLADLASRLCVEVCLSDLPVPQSLDISPT